MQIGKPLAPCGHEIDEALEDRLLAFTIEGPIFHIDSLAVVAPKLVPKEVFEAVLADEGVASDVEENVSLGGLRQQAQARRRIDRKHLVAKLPGAPALDLDKRLVARPSEGRG